MFAHLVRADLARLEREAPAAARRPLHHRRRHHPRGADPRGQRHRRRGDRRRPGRLDALSGLGAEPDRGGALPARRAADPAHRQARAPRLGRHAGAHGRDRGAAERELRPGPHRARLPAGGRRRQRRANAAFERAVPRAAAHDAQPRPRRPDAGSAGRRRGGRWCSASPAGARRVGAGTLGNFTGFVAALLLASQPAARARLAERRAAGRAGRAGPRVLA